MLNSDRKVLLDATTENAWRGSSELRAARVTETDSAGIRRDWIEIEFVYSSKFSGVGLGFVVSTKIEDDGGLTSDYLVDRVFDLVNEGFRVKGPARIKENMWDVLHRPRWPEAYNYMDYERRFLLENYMHLKAYPDKEWELPAMCH